MKRSLYILITILMVSILSGCGNKDELTKYYEEMSVFSSNLSDIKADMDNIDFETPECIPAFINNLERLDKEFEYLAGIHVPEEFISNADLASQAYYYMNESYNLFKKYFDSETSDYFTYQLASENYNRAMTRVSYIASILQGEIPEGASVIINNGPNTDFTPVAAEPEAYDRDDTPDESGTEYNADTTPVDQSPGNSIYSNESGTGEAPEGTGGTGEAPEGTGGTGEANNGYGYDNNNTGSNATVEEVEIGF
ncbi:MAG: hypothetical protein K5662_03460 [Lachnospiraceae bacterium]|nr:hypothetical protein [Lachnospiraceae bacterium]